MTTDPTDEFRRTSYEGWQASAAGWERARTFVEATAEAIREWMLRELASKPRETLLDLAAGPGETGFATARALGPDGRLISTDFSPAMVEVARRRASDLGLANVEHRVMDAERIDLPDDSVDGVLCRFGYMLMADPAAALRETRRVLRPAGRVVLAVWGPPERNPAFSTLGRTLVQQGHLPPPDPEAPGPFSLGDAGRLRELVEAAGFTDVRIEEVPAHFRFENVDDYLVLVADTSHSTATVLENLSEDAIDPLVSALEDGFAPYRVDGGYDVPGVALCAVAR